MPVYTCTTTTSTLTADIKGALAREIGRIHAEINHVPSTCRRTKPAVSQQKSRPRWLGSPMPTKTGCS